MSARAPTGDDKPIAAPRADALIAVVPSQLREEDRDALDSTGNVKQKRESWSVALINCILAAH